MVDATVEYGPTEAKAWRWAESVEHIYVSYEAPHPDGDPRHYQCPRIDGRLRYERRSATQGHAPWQSAPDAPRLSVLVNADGLECSGDLALDDPAIRWEDAASFEALNHALLDMVRRRSAHWRPCGGLTVGGDEPIVGSGYGGQSEHGYPVLGSVRWTGMLDLSDAWRVTASPSCSPTTPAVPLRVSCDSQRKAGAT